MDGFPAGQTDGNLMNKVCNPSPGYPRISAKDVTRRATVGIGDAMGLKAIAVPTRKRKIVSISKSSAYLLIAATTGGLYQRKSRQSVFSNGFSGHCWLAALQAIENKRLNSSQI